MFQVNELDLSSPAAFLIVGGLSLVDGVVPLVPARTALIGVGVIAGTGDRRAYPLLVVATLAAFVSDNLSYQLGAHLWPRLGPRLVRGDRGRRLWASIARGLTDHGFMLVALARIIPGGPTPITLMAGAVRFPDRAFRLAAAVSAVLWSAYAFAFGLIGGSVTSQPVFALIIGVLLAGALNLALRGWLRSRRPLPDRADISIGAPHRPDPPATHPSFHGGAVVTKESALPPTPPAAHHAIPSGKTR